MEDLDFLTTYLSPRQIKKLNKQSKKEKTIVQTKSLRGSQQISEDNSVTINIKELVAKTENQQKLIDSLETKTCIIARGFAGVGKTRVVTAYAARLFLQRKIEKIIISRPNVSTGRTLGLLPGSSDDKLTPFCMPMISVLKEYLGESLYELALKRGQIVMQPIEYIRGQSFSNSFIIIDECQNLEIEEAKSIITRIGENSKIAFMGDTKQSDLKHNNGLNFLVDGIMNNKEIYSYSSVIDFTIDDVVRSDLCAAWVKYLYSESA